MRSVVLSLLVVGVLPCNAQVQAPAVGQQAGSSSTRAIEGTVRDQAGAVASDAVVLLTDTKTLQVRSFIAQKDGKYHFYGLSTDVNYQIRAQANGLTTSVKTISVFDSHQRVVLNLKLKKKIKPDKKT